MKKSYIENINSIHINKIYLNFNKINYYLIDNKKNRKLTK